MSRRFYRIIASSLAALSVMLGAPAASFAQAGASTGVYPGAPPQPQFDEVRRVILQTLEEAKVPSIAVAVVKDGEIIWEEAFGWADAERGFPPRRKRLTRSRP